MSINDEAVEAAFRSMWGPNPSNPSDSGDAHLLKELRKALEAAAPFIAAEAWDEGARSTSYPDGSPITAAHHLPANPYRSQA